MEEWKARRDRSRNTASKKRNNTHREKNDYMMGKGEQKKKQEEMGKNGRKERFWRDVEYKPE